MSLAEQIPTLNHRYLKRRNTERVDQSNVPSIEAGKAFGNSRRDREVLSMTVQQLFHWWGDYVVYSQGSLVWAGHVLGPAGPAKGLTICLASGGQGTWPSRDVTNNHWQAERVFAAGWNFEGHPKLFGEFNNGNPKKRCKFKHANQKLHWVNSNKAVRVKI